MQIQDDWCDLTIYLLDSAESLQASRVAHIRGPVQGLV